MLTDHASSLLLCSTETAVENLQRENVAGQVHLVGDVMADVSLAFGPIARERSTVLADLSLEPGEYLLATAHRAGNVDDPERLERLVSLLEALPRTCVLPLHPRTAARLESSGLRERLDRARASAPLPTAGLPGLHGAGHARARDPHRLGGCPEGGLPAGRAVRDAAREHGMGGDRAHRLEHARGPRHRGGAGGPRAPSAIRRATGAVRRRTRGRARLRSALDLHCRRNDDLVRAGAGWSCRARLLGPQPRAQLRPPARGRS